MKQASDIEIISRALDDCGMSLSAHQIEQLVQYQQLIREWSGKQNLLSANDVERVFERHIVPSLYLCSLLDKTSGLRVLDIGSGAGFPGIVISIVRPDLEVTLIDSSRKKYLFLSEISENLKISCHVVHGRVESWLNDTGNEYEIIVSRAVTTLAELWLWAGRALKKNGKFYALKGGDLSIELALVRREEINTSEYTPSAEWLELSSHLDGKKVVKMEKIHV